ncbi:helix-turn-helix domain-containing protein [Streptomyces sp. GMY02]|uniref:helix-turn-helix transcriptional regulator n=1 Tax=Streptomyces sp. GMY02 TaxID=1333528 RepID=UPI001C2B82D2|nr:helix-turn-helix transcriptional regulator [Streptomyces sp. GMY02]QXE35104.1 helix-turn-helix domain-containing protein [Streptomyces sp. GMY02]
MGLAERRKALGYSQEGLAQVLGVDRTTVGRWETGRTCIQPPLRPKYAEALQLGLAELDALMVQPATTPQEAVRSSSGDRYGSRNRHGSGDRDDVIRREFLRALAVAGALAGLPSAETDNFVEGVQRQGSDDFTRMNGHLWQVYRLARAKASVHPIVRDQLAVLTETLGHRSHTEARALCGAAGDIFQLAGELAFDDNRYTDAAASYLLAASASKEAGSYDLWACALIRHAYVDVHEQRYQEAAGVLSAAERIARRGDSSLSTRHWVAAVQAEAFAGLGDLEACERALDQAEKVVHLAGSTQSVGWLRFDGSRLAEERGARYVQLGRLDLAERTLRSALGQTALAEGQSFRRRGVVLANLAAIGVKREDPEQVVSYGRQAVHLARESSSGYVVRRLQALRSGFGNLAHDVRVAELEEEIDALSATHREG